MECMKFNMNKDGEQDNYGIYDFFKYSDEQERLKCSFVIDDDYYIISSCGANGRDHEQLIREIASEFFLKGVNIFGGSLGGDLEIIVEKNDVTNNEIQHMIGILQELKKYYLDTNRDKNIAIFGAPFNDVKLNSNKFYCKDIDGIINELEKLKKSKEL